MRARPALWRCDDGESAQPIGRFRPWCEWTKSWPRCKAVRRFTRANVGAMAVATRCARAKRPVPFDLVHEQQQVVHVSRLSLVVGGLGLRTAPLCTCFCPTSVCSVCGLACRWRSRRQLHAWKRLDHSIRASSSKRAFRCTTRVRRAAMATSVARGDDDAAARPNAIAP